MSVWIPEDPRPALFPDICVMVGVMNIKVEVEIKRETIQNLISCALQGAHYWASHYEFNSLDWTKEANELVDKLCSGSIYNVAETAPTVDGAFIKVFDGEDDDKEYVLGTLAIQNGLNAMSRVSRRHFADVLRNQIDAITGDVFLQCCLFGEVVYG